MVDHEQQWYKHLFVHGVHHEKTWSTIKDQDDHGWPWSLFRLGKYINIIVKERAFDSFRLQDRIFVYILVNCTRNKNKSFRSFKSKAKHSRE